LSHIRETDAIAEVVRIFKDDKIIHVDKEVNPLRDIDVINLELVLADLDTVTKRLANIHKDVKAQKKEAILEEGLLLKVKKVLEDGKLANGIDLHDDEKPILKQLNLLSVKPILYVLNSSEASENEENILSKIPGAFIKVDPVFESGLNDLIKKSYEVLDLMTYFTTGEDETRAWTIKRNSTAPIAGMAIHTDFKDKFIRAEVIEWQKLLEAGSYAHAREKGLVRTEGKEYVVKDGDVVEFKI
jgi:ribosome-binding ATPase YchF (GTP1/OBG family)